MLFVQLMKPRADINWQECIKRSLQYRFPAAAGEVIGEYVLSAREPFYIGLFKADNMAQITAANMPWIDFFDISVYPACTMQEMRDMTGAMLAASGQS